MCVTDLTTVRIHASTKTGATTLRRRSAAKNMVAVRTEFEFLVQYDMTDLWNCYVSQNDGSNSFMNGHLTPGLSLVEIEHHPRVCQCKLSNTID